MSSLLNKLANRLANLENFVMKTVEIEARRRQAILRELNVKQLEKGMDSLLVPLPEYAPSSVAKGKRKGPIRLLETGLYHGSIRAVVDSQGITMTNIDSKAAMLAEKYGEAIIGLSVDSIAIFTQSHLLPSIGIKVLNYLRVA